MCTNPYNIILRKKVAHIILYSRIMLDVSNMHVSYMEKGGKIYID